MRLDVVAALALALDLRFGKRILGRQVLGLAAVRLDVLALDPLLILHRCLLSRRAGEDPARRKVVSVMLEGLVGLAMQLEVVVLALVLRGGVLGGIGLVVPAV